MGWQHNRGNGVYPNNTGVRNGSYPTNVSGGLSATQQRQCLATISAEGGHDAIQQRSHTSPANLSGETSRDGAAQSGIAAIKSNCPA